MSAETLTEPTFESVELRLRDELARGETALATATPLLRHLLQNDDPAMFSDEVVARVRGMIADVARQLLHAQAEAARIADRSGFLAEREERLAGALADDSALLAHFHALTLEAKLTLQLQARNNIDPVLSPLLQELVGSQEDAVAGLAMAVLAAQARFIQHHRRMALPLGELPGDLFHRALLVLRTNAGERENAAAAERDLRNAYYESHGRLGLIARLVTRVGKTSLEALNVGHAGLATFATTLAMASGQERDRTVLALSDRHAIRLAVAMRAAGMSPAMVEEQFLYLHPEGALHEGFEGLDTERAVMLLASSQPQAG